MVEQTDSKVEALDKVHVQMYMTTWVAGRNMENELALSNLAAMVGKVAHVDIDFHTAIAISVRLRICM